MSRLTSLTSISRGAVLLGAAAALVLTGCSQSVDEASSDYCANLDTLNSELASLDTLVTGDATVEEIEDQVSAVESAADDVESSGGDLDSAVSDAADSAASDFDAAVGEISGDASLSEASADYEAAVASYINSLASIADEAGCDS